MDRASERAGFGLDVVFALGPVGIFGARGGGAAGERELDGGRRATLALVRCVKCFGWALGGVGVPAGLAPERLGNARSRSSLHRLGFWCPQRLAAQAS